MTIKDEGRRWRMMKDLLYACTKGQGWRGREDQKDALQPVRRASLWGNARTWFIREKTDSEGREEGRKDAEEADDDDDDDDDDDEEEEEEEEELGYGVGGFWAMVDVDFACVHKYI